MILTALSFVTIICINLGHANPDSYSYITATNSNGEYEFVLPEGTYNVLVSKKGYYPQLVKNVLITAGQTNYMENIIISDIIAGALSSEVNGRVTNALTGEMIANAQVRFRKSWNNTSGAYVSKLFSGTVKANTNSHGTFEVSLQIGNYTAEVVKDGYITGYYNIISTLNPGTQNMVLTPVIQDNQYRIVLTWGSTPADLDSHLAGKLEDGTAFHVYYSNKVFGYKGSTIAQLDLDDTSGYGPETITLTLKADIPGTYRYIVHDYTNRTSFSSNALSLSGASVKIYRGNDLIKTYNVPINERGNLWRVFEINNGVINTLNTMSYQSSSDNIN
ncbi:carboxypeptidase regulatory-like domain-containing protein [Anaerocolumna xylanovorans]|uniref:carboxypeptidase regulatory-like domain-containing protein n=1 Tax=Anaerocolumna xylanovorans TaxID=100134 RepID=UPI0009FF2A4F|nr:carboxypeptidase regulatory-like domain-containing protein [Anaerocolumna xylanovorans]